MSLVCRRSMGRSQSVFLSCSHSTLFLSLLSIIDPSTLFSLAQADQYMSIVHKRGIECRHIVGRTVTLQIAARENYLTGSLLIRSLWPIPVPQFWAGPAVISTTIVVR